ncbi:MAG: polymer-forming cytoskeletal protein [Terriglobales bacterium]|jgi:cytoskeletal protein CcmA (bactofilin family)
MDAPKTNEFAHIGKSVIIKGELSGSEDLFVDGVVEGTIELRNNNLVIGPNGQVKANIHAKGVVVQGKLDGDIRASQRAELRKSAIVVGDVFTQRIAIEEGAYFKGKVDIQQEAAKPVSAQAAKSEPEVKGTAQAPVASASSASATVGAGSNSMSQHTSVTKV